MRSDIKIVVALVAMFQVVTAGATVKIECRDSVTVTFEEPIHTAAGQEKVEEDIETNVSGVMSLKDCMQYAVSNSTQVRIQQTKLGDARLDRRDAILKTFTPYVEGNAYGYYRWGRSIDPETNTYVTTTSLNNGYSLTAGITLFDGFSAVNNMKITKTSISMGVSQEQQEIDKVCLATIEAYCNVVYYSKLAEILKEQAENARASVTLATRQEELGTKGHADVVQMKADLADKEYDLISAVNSRNDAMITLQDVMFWPVNEELVIDEDLESIELSASDDSQVEDVIDRAQTIMPSVLIAKGTMDNALLSLRTEKWRYLPTVGLYGGWSTSYYTYPGQAGYVPVPYGRQFKNNGGEYLELSVTIPIYSRLQRHTKVAKCKNEYSRASMEYDKSMRDVESEVRRAMQDKDGAEVALEQAERRAEAQSEAYRLNTRKFEQGLISSIEYNTASSNYLKAKAEELNARLKFQLKRRVVQYYNGISYLEQ